MAHSYDSTLLQRMGFKDPDRQTPEHDRACIELAGNPVLLLSALGLQTNEARVALEQPLQKGDGKYASTVGFIDALVTWQDSFPTTHCKRTHYESVWTRCDECKDGVSNLRCAMLVEVKTSIGNVGDLLRQMNLYKEYKQRHNYVTVNPFVVWSLDKHDIALSPLLAGQGYRSVFGDLQSLLVGKGEP